MKIVTWDSGIRFDDPNLRWGTPSYLLEPGDPGYINTGLPPEYKTTQKTKKHAMNETPKNPNMLRGLAHDLADGLATLQDVIGMKQNREPEVRTALKKIEGDPAAAAGSAARKGSELVYDECKAATRTAFEAVETLLDGSVKKFLSAYRNVLADVHGARWTAAWAPGGFAGPTTSIPGAEEGKLALLTTAHSYLSAHPEMERPASAPQTAVTAAAALTLREALSDARSLVNAKQGEQRTCRDVRDADVDALYRRISGTIREVGQVLSDTDGRWETLGLNIPANPRVPEPVTSLTLSPAGPGRLLATWPRARRATRYKVEIKVAGVDPDFREADAVLDLEAVVKDLPSGGSVQVRIIASNAGGDTTPSPAATTTVP